MQSWVAVLEEKMSYACIVCSGQKFSRLDYCNAATTAVSLDTSTTTGDRTSVTTTGVLMYRHLTTRRNLYRETHREIHDKIKTVGEKGSESCGVSWPQAQHMSVHCRRPLTHVRCRPIHNSSHAAIRSNDEITHAAVHPV